MMVIICQPLPHQKRGYRRLSIEKTNMLVYEQKEKKTRILLFWVCLIFLPVDTPVLRVTLSHPTHAYTVHKHCCRF